MIGLALLALLAQPADAFLGPMLTRSKARLRELDCERMPDERAAARYPGRIRVPESRAADPDRSVVICTERLLPGLRAARDEAVLAELGQTAARIAGATGPYQAELAGRTWLVEAFDPSPVLGAKARFAVQAALMASGLAVSDRLPALAVGEIGVLTRLPPLQAYPAACQRFTASGSLGPNDALVAVVALDARATVLHAGLCVDGAWRWLP